MARKIQKVHKTRPRTREPKTQIEALTMIAKIWGWLIKKNPAIFLPLTFWMLFGGAYYAYNYIVTDKVNIKDAQPLSENKSEISIMPQAVAGEQVGNPIIFNGKLWGYEDTTYIAKVDKLRPVILVYNKNTKEVKQVEFEVSFNKQLKR